MQAGYIPSLLLTFITLINLSTSRHYLGGRQYKLYYDLGRSASSPALAIIRLSPHTNESALKSLLEWKQSFSLSLSLSASSHLRTTVPYSLQRLRGTEACEPSKLDKPESPSV